MIRKNWRVMKMENEYITQGGTFDSVWINFELVNAKSS